MEVRVTTATGTFTTATSTTASSVLDKPLHELTEDDISQLTREDCRRYLKEKGMRRPSWNKSQAIQQVISLKSLLESPLTSSVAPTPPPPPKSTAVAPPRPLSEIPTTPHVNSNSTVSTKDLSPANVDDGGLSSAAGSLDSDPPREADSGYQPGVSQKAESFRRTDAINSQAGQMTIFYCGKVNVYDVVPAEKAQAIMELAASPIQFLQDEPVIGNAPQWPATNHLPTSNVGPSVISPGASVSQQSVQIGKTRDYVQQHRQEGNFHETDVEGQTNRQVSLQRYLEKKKDRGRLKSKKKVGSSLGLEMYLNNQMRVQVLNGEPSRTCGISSPSQPGQQRIFCNPLENQLKNAGSPLDLNDKA